MKIAYLVNQYPKVSHTFIRREISALEATGITVERFAIRTCRLELIDDLDKAELAKTKAILEVGPLWFLINLLRVLLIAPVRFFKAVWFTIKIGWKSDRGLFHHLVYLAEACILFRWSNLSKVTHVHAHFGTNSASVAMLCHALGGPTYSFTVHGPEEFDKAILISLGEKIRRATFVIAVCSFGRSQLYRWAKYEDWAKIHVVRCGVDPTYLLPNSIAIPEYPRLVCVGRLCEQKGHLLLLESTSRLIMQGIKFTLVLVGDGPLRSQIEILVDQLGLQNHVEITGWASNTEVKQQILAARAMVLPSFAEGLPVVIMEALALGRPVLSTYIAGIPELIEPGICGWLIPPGSVEDLTSAMKNILQTPVIKLEQMGRLGASRVAQRHNVATTVMDLVVLLQNSQPNLLDGNKVAG